MSIDFLGRVIGSQGQGVERVVDARGVERGIAFRRGGLVELREVEASRLLCGGLCVLGRSTGVLVFFCC